MIRVTLVAAVIAAALLASPAEAHKLKVFATAVGPSIEGRVYFVGGGGAPGATVRIVIPDGAPPLTLQTGADGTFAFTATVRADHDVIADSGDGHSARVTIAAADLPAALPLPAGASVGSSPSLALVPDAAAAAPTPASSAVSLSSGGVALEDLVAKAVAQQIRPLREEINTYEDQVRMHDIVGGIGYIVGLAGLTLWLRVRRAERGA